MVTYRESQLLLQVAVGVRQLLDSRSQRRDLWMCVQRLVQLTLQLVDTLSALLTKLMLCSKGDMNQSVVKMSKQRNSCDWGHLLSNELSSNVLA